MTRNLEEFNGKHKDQVCFIICPGPSVAEQDLEPLKNHVTIVVNSGYLAAPWATYFISDDWSVAKFSYFAELANSKHITVLLYENKLSNTAHLFGDRAVLFRHCKGINIPDIYEHKNPKNHIGETRSSLGSGIMISKIMGCSKIVLIGADCCRYNGYRYFWQAAPQKGPYRVDHVPLDNYKKCNVRGQVTDYDLLEIAKSWNILGPAINKKCSVYNASPISILRIFPKIDLKEFLEKELLSTV